MTKKNKNIEKNRECLMNFPLHWIKKYKSVKEKNKKNYK